MKKILTALAFCFAFTSTINASSIPYWTLSSKEQMSFQFGNADIKTARSNYFTLDLEGLKNYLASAPSERSGLSGIKLLLPTPDGQQQLFSVKESPIMESGLANKYPGIKTYIVQGLTNTTACGRLDVTYLGFHAMILDGDKTFFIDPYNRNTSTEYLCYYKTNALSKYDGNYCAFNPESPENVQRVQEITQDVELRGAHPVNARSIAGTLRTYRLALACTGEYAAYFGGTKPATLSAMITSVNRVTGVYEREIDVRLILISNTDTLIFLNANTDPYTNNNGGTMLGQNQSTVNSYIGSANYDIGHVFSTGGGGIAGLGVVCGGSKAQGVTGSTAPVGDPYDIDYVAHEMGHQFGGNHTFNGNTGSCAGNGNASTAYEPGSGTTIMAYAGICAPQDIAVHSDAFFHTASFDEIVNYTTISTGNNCAVQSATGNNAPVITSIGSNVSIPLSTPFMLTGAANDPDGDTLTYSWEEYDLGPAGAPSTPSGNAPLIRSLPASLNPTRIVPRLNYIISNNPNPLGEKLPTYARSMKFRLTARDNKAGGGGVTYDPTLITLNAVNTGAPFLVTIPNVLLTWPAMSQQTVTWDVAGTDVAPISATTVDILLSTDGGFTYPITLASAVPNNGSCSVIMPNQTTTTARVMVKPTNNIFFDISNKNFIISAPQGFVENVMVSQQVSVSPNPASSNFLLSWLGDYQGIYDLQIVDMQGRMIESIKGEKKSEEMSVSISIADLSKGVYSFIIQTPQGKIIQRLIKQ
ncbi:MAG: reprolysin-like metallopeptidase [Bacteroidota bacterium]